MQPTAAERSRLNIDFLGDFCYNHKSNEYLEVVRAVEGAARKIMWFMEKTG